MGSLWTGFDVYCFVVYYLGVCFCCWIYDDYHWALNFYYPHSNSQKEGATSKTDSGRKQSQSASSAAARGTEGTKVGIMSKEEGTVRSATVKSRSGADGDV